MIQDPKNFLTRVSKLMTHVLNSNIEGAPQDNTAKVEAQREKVEDNSQESVLKQAKSSEKSQTRTDFDAEIVIDKDGNPQVSRKN